MNKQNRGSLLAGSGCLLGILPIIIALVGGLVTGGNPWSEGSGAGSVIWLMFLTLPIGLIVFIVGLVLRARDKRKPTPTD